MNKQPQTDKAYLEIEQKLINLMLLHQDIIAETIDSGITSDSFEQRHRPLVHAIYHVHGESGGKRLLTDDHYRALLIQSGGKGDITIPMQIYHECSLGVHISNAKNDFDLLKRQFLDSVARRKGLEAMQAFNNNVRHVGYAVAMRTYAEQLRNIVDATSAVTALEPVSLDDLVAGGSRREWTWYNMIARGCVTVLAAKRKLGKSTLIADFLRLSESGGCLISEVVPTKVLYVTEENRDDWHARVEDHALPRKNIDVFLVLEHPELISPSWDKFESFMRRICQLVVERSYGLVIFDTISKMVPIEDERDTAGWHRVFKGMYSITNKNAGVLMVHHCRKTEGADALDVVRGSGAICDNAHNIMVLGTPKKGSKNERVLDVWGRFDSPRTFLLDYNEDTKQYCSVNASEHKEENDLVQAIDRLLEKIGDMDSNALVAQLSHTSCRANVMRMLRKGTELGFWIRSGKGTKGEPHVYAKKEDTELQERETKEALELAESYL